MPGTKNRTRPPHYKSRYKDGLTPRERDVLTLLATGRTNAQIAEALDVGFETIKWHVSGILGKLCVDSREEAAALWTYDHSLRGRLERTWNALLGIATGKAATMAGASVAVVAALAIAVVAIALTLNGHNDEDIEILPAPTPRPLGLRVDRTVSLPAALHSDFTIAGGAVWGREYPRSTTGGLAPPDDTADTLIRYDITTGAVTETVVGPVASPVVAAGDSVWTAAPWNESLKEVDARTGAVLRTVPLPFELRPRSWMDLLADETNIWVSARTFSTVLRISTITGEIQAQASLATRPARLTLAFGSLWVTLIREATVARLDPMTLEIQALISLDLVPPAAPGVAEGVGQCGACTQGVLQSGGFIWAFSDNPPTFSKIDPVTETVVQHFKLRDQHPDLWVSGGLEADQNGDIWFINIGGSQPVGEVLRFDVRNGIIAEKLQLVTDPKLLGAGHPPVSPWGLRVQRDAIWVTTLENQLIRVAR